MKSKRNPSLPLPGIRWRGFTLQLFLITVLPLSVLLVVIVLISQSLHKREMTSLVGDRDLQAVRSAADGLQEEFNHLAFSLQMASRLATNPADLTDLAAYRDLINFDFDGGLAFYSQDGELISSNNGAAYWQNLAEESPDFWDSIQSASTDTVIFSHKLIGVSGDSRLAMAAIQRPEGTILVGGFTPKRLVQAMLSGSLASSTSALIVTDGQGQPIYQSGVLPAGSQPGQQAGIDAALGLDSGVNYYSASHGEIVITFAPILPPGWSLVIAENWEDTVSPFLNTTQSAPLLLIPLLLLTLLALLFGARQVIQPIQDLEQKAARLARGDFQAIREPVGGIEEIRRLQAGLKHMAEDLQSAQSALRSYIGSITAGVENERRNLARELHDDTLQSLIALNQRVQMAALKADDNDERVSLRQVQERVEGTISGLRRLVRGMRPIYLEELGLASSLEMLANETSAEANVPVNFSLKGEPQRLNADAELALYRMAQEGLHNAVRHAQASNIELELDFLGESLRLIIRDNGCGFAFPEAHEAFARHGHFGLLGLQERAELIGAHLRIESGIGTGTQIEVVFPM
jgi:signal transduction histidine kinase